MNDKERLEETLKRLKDKYEAFENEYDAEDEDGMIDISVACELAESVPFLIEDLEKMERENKRYQEALKKIMLEQHQYMEGYETETFSIAKNALGMSENDVINLLEGTE